MQKILKLLFFIVVATLSLGQFSNLLGFFAGGTQKLYLFDIALFIYVIFSLGFFLFKKEKLIIPKYLAGFIIFTQIAFLSLIPVLDRYGLSVLINSSAYFLRWTFYLLGAIVTYNLVEIKTLIISDVFKAFILSGVFISVAGFIQLLVLPDFTVLDPIFGWDPHKNRLASTFFDPNFVGGYLVLIINLILFTKYKLKGQKYFLLFLILALLLTYSRSAWGMFAISLFFYGLKKNIWIIMIGFTLAFSAYFAIPRIQTRVAGITDPSDSAHFRLISWAQTLKIVEDNVFLGVGYNAIEQEKIERGYIYVYEPVYIREHSASGSDSSFLLVLATTGFLGFVAFTFSYLFPLFDNLNYLKLGFTFSLLLQTQFINALFFPQIMFIWLIVFSLFYTQ